MCSRLADKYGAGRLEAACGKAISVGDPSYRTVKGILAAGTETDGQHRRPRRRSPPAHLHGPERLFNLVALPRQARDDAEVAA